MSKGNQKAHVSERARYANKLAQVARDQHRDRQEQLLLLSAIARAYGDGGEGHRQIQVPLEAITNPPQGESLSIRHRLPNGSPGFVLDLKREVKVAQAQEGGEAPRDPPASP